MSILVSTLLAVDMHMCMTFFVCVSCSVSHVTIIEVH